MARLRFPGRPGQRFGRSLIRFMPEEARNCRNRFFNLTANIHKNLRAFYDHFGDSDEEDDFHGFTSNEIGTPSDKEFTEAFDDGDFSLLVSRPDGSVSARVEYLRQSLNLPPTSESTRPGLKTSVRRSYLDMHRGTDRSRRQTHASIGVDGVKIGKDTLHKVKNIQMKAKDKLTTVMGKKPVLAKPSRDPKKPKSIKFRFKMMRGGKRAKIVSSPGKKAAATKRAPGKTVKKDRAKSLLAKARQRKVQRGGVATTAAVVKGKRNVKVSHKLAGMMVTGVADMHFLNRTLSPEPFGQSSSFTPSSTKLSSAKKRFSSSPSPARVPRQFVMPYKSSRSSRVIKPCKRFIEEVGAEAPHSKQFKIGMETISRDVKKELIDSFEEFEAPNKLKKTFVPKPATPAVGKSSLAKNVSATSKLSKVLSTKVKKVFSEKQFKASKAAQLVKKSQLVEKKHKEKLKAKKQKLLDKKRIEKRKKLEAKRKRKKKLALEKKAKLKKSKPPKKSKDAGKNKGNIVNEDVKKSKDLKKDKHKKGREEKMEMHKESPSQLSQVITVADVKLSPRKVRKSAKRKLKEEAKQLKKTYNELKKTIPSIKEGAKIENFNDTENDHGYIERVQTQDFLDEIERRKRLKDLAKRHKEVCNTLRKIQKENVLDIHDAPDIPYVPDIPSVPDSPYVSDICHVSTVPIVKKVHKQRKKKAHRKADKDHSKSLADKILRKAKERMGLVDLTLQREMKKEQKENRGPLRSPTESSAFRSAALAEGASRAVSDLVCRQMAEALEADMSPEQAKAASQREMKRRRQQLKEQSKIQVNRGPRIKHVSRRASVALGYSPARYSEDDSPPVSDFALSALSPNEKRRLLEPNNETVRWSSDDDGARTNNLDRDYIPSNVKRSPLSKKTPFSRKRPFGPKRYKPVKRLKAAVSRRKPGVACLKPDVACLNLIDEDLKSHVRSLKTAVAPLSDDQLISKKRIVNKRYKKRKRCGICPGCLEKDDCQKCINCLDKPKYGGPGTKKQCCMYRKCANLIRPAPTVDRTQHPSANKPKSSGSLISELTSLDRVLVPRQASPASARSSSPASTAGSLVPGPSSSGPVGLRIKRPSAQGVARTILTRERKKKAMKELDVQIDSPSPPQPKLKLSIQQELSKHLVKFDFREDYDLGIAWMRGMAIISSQPMIPRTVCYLCSSTGKHELIYCNVCCEPFHEFCLDEDERPLQGHLDKWCCRNCVFCYVCGRQDHLLNCAKCQTSYHAECLGPNYPTKPSNKRKIWVCTRCVKCKSCGATTPGQHSSAQWSHDFSLCQDCGKLFDMGNYCPICSKCYADDDYVSKMMECAKCKSWIHAKCEGLTDDMYHILTDLPDTVPYVCLVCDPVRPAKWQIEMAEEMQAGFLNVMTALYGCKNASHLIWPEKRKKKCNRSKSPADSSKRSTASPAPSDITTCSSTPLEELCESDSLPTPLRAISGGCTKSESPILTSTPDRTLYDTGDLEESNSKIGTDPLEETSLMVKPTYTTLEEEGAKVKLKQVNSLEETSATVKSKHSSDSMKETSAVVKSNLSEQLNNEKFLVCETSNKMDAAAAVTSNLDYSTVVDVSDGNVDHYVMDEQSTSSPGPEILPTEGGSGQNYQLRETLSENITEKRLSPVPTNDLSKRTMPFVDEAPRTSMPCVPEEITNDKIVEETVAKQTDITKAKTKESKSTSECSKFAVLGEDHCVEVSKDTATIDRTSKPGASSGDLETTGSKSSASALKLNNIGDKDNETLPKASEVELGITTEGPVTTTTPSTSSAMTVAKDDIALSPMQQSSQPNSIPDCNSTMDQETAESKIADNSMQTDGNVSLSESMDEGTLTATMPDSANVSRSESTDSAPETEVVEAVDNGGVSRRITRLSLQRKTTDTSRQSPPGLESTAVIRSTQKQFLPYVPRLTSPPAARNVLLPSLSDVAPVEDASLMRLMASVINKVIHGEPLTDAEGSQLVSDLQQQDQVLLAEKKNYPKDFRMVKAKVQAGAYNSIIDFCDDCVRIIQCSMLTECSQNMRKNNRVTRTVFTKIMEKMFPWFKVGTSTAWQESVKYPDAMLPAAVLPPNRDHEYAQWKYRTKHIPNALQPSPLKKFAPRPVPAKRILDTTSEDSQVESDRTETPPPEPNMEDLRRCSLCGQYSDDGPNNAGRLLYCGQNDWIHINCALWSAEVFEEVDGSLINVHTAVSRGRHMKCDFCHKVGATVGCCTQYCPANYHFMCARQVNALFQEDKKVFCARHGRMVRKKLVEEDMFAVLRRMCVSLDTMKMNKHFINGIQVNRINFMVGSLTLDSMGRLGPLSETKDTLYPIDYKIQRVFWSTQDPRRRCVYTVRISEVKPEKVSPCIIEETNLTTLHDLTYDGKQLQRSRMLLKIAEDPLNSSCPSFKKSGESINAENLSLSWPTSRTKGLSAKTLKHLPKTILQDISTPSSISSSLSPQDLEEEGDLTLNLNNMVMSLNHAAAESKKIEQSATQGQSMEMTSDLDKCMTDDGHAQGQVSSPTADGVENITIQLDDSLLNALDSDGALISVEKLIGEALSEEQSLDQVVMLFENLNNAIDDEINLKGNDSQLLKIGKGESEELNSGAGNEISGIESSGSAGQPAETENTEESSDESSAESRQIDTNIDLQESARSISSSLEDSNFSSFAAKLVSDCDKEINEACNSPQGNNKDCAILGERENDNRTSVEETQFKDLVEGSGAGKDSSSVSKLSEEILNHERKENAHVTDSIGNDDAVGVAPGEAEENLKHIYCPVVSKDSEKQIEQENRLNQTEDETRKISMTPQADDLPQGNDTTHNASISMTLQTDDLPQGNDTTHNASISMTPQTDDLPQGNDTTHNASISVDGQIENALSHKALPQVEIESPTNCDGIIEKDTINTDTDDISAKTDTISTKVDAFNTQTDAINTENDAVTSKIDGVNANTDVNIETDAVNTESDAVQTKTDAANTGTDKVNTGPDDVNTGTYDVSAGPGDVNTGTDDFNTGADDINTGTDDCNTGTDNVSTGTDDVNTGTGGVNTGTDDVNTSTDDCNTGTDDVNTGTDHVNTDTDVNTGTYDCNTGADYVNTGTDNKASTDDCNTGTDNFNAGTDFNTGIDDVNTGTDEVNTDTDDVNTGTDDVIPGTDVNTGTYDVIPGTDINTGTDATNIEIDVVTIKTDSASTEADNVSTDTDVNTETFDVSTEANDVDTGSDAVQTEIDAASTGTDVVNTVTYVNTGRDDVNTDTDDINTGNGIITSNTDGVNAETDEVNTETDVVNTRTGVNMGTNDVNTGTVDVNTCTAVNTATDDVNTTTDANIATPSSNTNTDTVIVNSTVCLDGPQISLDPSNAATISGTTSNVNQTSRVIESQALTLQDLMTTPQIDKTDIIQIDLEPAVPNCIPTATCNFEHLDDGLKSSSQNITGALTKVAELKDSETKCEVQVVERNMSDNSLSLSLDNLSSNMEIINDQLEGLKDDAEHPLPKEQNEEATPSVMESGIRIASPTSYSDNNSKNIFEIFKMSLNQMNQAKYSSSAKNKKPNQDFLLLDVVPVKDVHNIANRDSDLKSDSHDIVCARHLNCHEEYNASDRKQHIKYIKAVDPDVDDAVKKDIHPKDIKHNKHDVDSHVEYLSSGEDNFAAENPTLSSPLDLDLSKTPVVILHDLRRRSLSGSHTNDNSFNLDKDLEILSNVEECHGGKFEDSISSLEISKDSNTGCEVFCSISDSERNKASKNMGKLAGILEQVLPKHIKVNSHSVNTNTNQKNTHVETEGHVVNSDCEIDYSTVHLQTEPQIVEVMGSTEKESEIDGEVLKEDINTVEKLSDCVENSAVSSGSDHRVECIDVPLLPKWDLRTDLVKVSESGVYVQDSHATIEASTVTKRKDHDINKLLVIKCDKREAGKLSEGNNKTNVGQEARGTDKFVNKPEVNKESFTIVKNVTDVANAALGDEMKMRDVKNYPKAACVSMPVKATQKNLQITASACNTSWESQFNKFINSKSTTEKPTNKQVNKGGTKDKSGNEKLRNKKFYLDQHLCSQDAPAAMAKDDDKLIVSASGKWNVKLAIRPKRKPEKLTDFVPDSNLDTIDISQPGRKKYPMRSTARRLLRIAETGEDGNEQVVCGSEYQEQKIEETFETIDEKRVITRSLRGVSQGNENSEKAEKEEKDSQQKMDNILKTYVIKRGRGRPPKKKSENKVVKDMITPPREPRRSGRLGSRNEIDSKFCDSNVKGKDENVDENPILEVKQGQGRPRQSKVLEDSLEEEVEKNDSYTPCLKKGRGRPRKVVVNTLEKLDCNIENKNTDNDDTPLALLTGKGEHVISRKKLEVGTLKQPNYDNIEGETLGVGNSRSPELAGKGRKRKMKIHLDYIQVDEEFPTDDDDMTSVDDQPLNKNRRKREGSLSWKKKAVDPDWSPQMDNESLSAKKALRKLVKSPERKANKEVVKTVDNECKESELSSYEKAILYLEEQGLKMRARSSDKHDVEECAEEPDDTGKSTKVKSTKLSETLPLLEMFPEEKNVQQELQNIVAQKPAMYGSNKRGPVRGRRKLTKGCDISPNTTGKQKDKVKIVIRTSDKRVNSDAVCKEPHTVSEVSSQDTNKKDDGCDKGINASTHEQDITHVINLVKYVEKTNANAEKKAVTRNQLKPIQASEHFDVERSSPGKDSISETIGVTSSNQKVNQTGSDILCAEMTALNKSVDVSAPKTSPILKSCLTKRQEKSESPELVAIVKDARPSLENNAEAKSDQVFIPVLSPRSEAAPRLPVQPILSPPQTPKIVRVPRSPIISPTPLPPPKYYTIVQPASKEITFSHPGGIDSSSYGPMRVRGRIRMRGGRMPLPNRPYLCETRLNRPPPMQIIPTLSPLHHVQSLYNNKLVVQKDVIDNSGYVVSGNTFQPVQQILNTSTRTPSVNLTTPFQVTSTVDSVLPQIPISPLPTISPHSVQVISGGPTGLIHIPASTPKAPIQVLQSPTPNTITVHVNAPQTVLSNSIIVQQQQQPVIVSSVNSTVVAPHPSEVPSKAKSGSSSLLPTNAQLLASGIIPSQGLISHHVPSSTVELLPRTTPTSTDRQHYVSILRQYSNSLRTKSQALNNLLLSSYPAPNQLTTPTTAASIATPSSMQTSFVTNLLPTTRPSVNTAPVQCSTHVTMPTGASYLLPSIAKSNTTLTSEGDGMNPLAMNMLNSLAQKHNLTSICASRQKLLVPVSTVSSANIVQSPLSNSTVHKNLSVRNTSHVGILKPPSNPRGSTPSLYPSLMKQSEVNSVANLPEVTTKRSLSDVERLTGAKKRKTAHSSTVWFDAFGRLQDTLEDFSAEDEITEIRLVSSSRPSQARMKTPSLPAKPRTKVPTFGPSKDVDRVVIGGGLKTWRDAVVGSNASERIQGQSKPPSHLQDSADISDKATMGGVLQFQSVTGPRSRSGPSIRRDKWAAPPPPPKPELIRPNVLNLESTEQSTVQSDFDQGEKMSITPEEDDDVPSLLLQLMEKENKKPKHTEQETKEPHLIFEVTSDDGFHASGKTMEEAWSKVVRKVEERRSDTRMTNLSFAGINPLKILGVSHDALVFLIEQLYGARNCQNYKFRYHQYYDAELDEEPELNPNFCARAEPFKERNYYDMFNFLASRHRKRPQPSDADEQDETMHKSARRATSISDLPMAMRFRHLKETAKEAVGVYRSHIHGRGLFCKRTIDAGEMVIEYTGTVIRSTLTDKREKYYESKGIGCYMFRIDDYDVIDATMHGSAARFINHSCEPNCFSRVIQVGTSKHIVIFASRKITTGEELTYDYKFPIEEVKIPCNCKAVRCRKYLN